MYSLCTFRQGTDLRSGLLMEEEVVDLQKGAAQYGVDGLSSIEGVLQILERWDDLRDLIDKLAESAKSDLGALQREEICLSRETASLAAPILYPRKIFCAAANYVDHSAEMGNKVDKEGRRPYFFMKPPTVCTAGPEDDIPIPSEPSEQIDWEVELAVVIGRGGRRISASDALAHVAGYMVINDLSSRGRNPRSDWQFKYDWFAGKCFDRFAPMGPGVVPARFVLEPQKLPLKLWVNGTLMQDSNTSYMIFNVREQIEYLSEICTLEPGDVIATGTPAGVGKPRGIFLKHGDLVEASVEGLGTLRNKMV